MLKRNQNVISLMTKHLETMCQSAELRLHSNLYVLVSIPVWINIHSIPFTGQTRTLPCAMNRCTEKISSPSNFVLSVSMLPRDPTMFFGNWPHAKKLPTPAQIRASAFDSPVMTLYASPNCQRILHFPELGLIIKHGERTTIAEGQTLWALSKFCPEVRTPTVYGWCKDDDEVFIYMSYIDGVTLDSRLEALGENELMDVAQQLAQMLASIRRLRQPPENTFIGSPDHGPVHDQIWWQAKPVSAFSSVKEFNDALFAFAEGLPQFPEHKIYQDFRTSFLDSASIRFTHTDLSPNNIIMSSTGTEVMGIIDWQESGWYPDHWEYVKARYIASTEWDNLSTWSCIPMCVNLRH
ncbi:hypothetical protein D9619_008701 [Psilocybe cf. subviscida]|uniref:Aminoglycoside phosphotransferase domain-containing protein n=1 Tax=Psilocybe cf. subviscida TaxID=2480587 RepID=A0A8H5B9M2_9AGAR|nr:hypothetical protein D9619_008701 [Psilocybe cf. subviscida]